MMQKNASTAESRLLPAVATRRQLEEQFLHSPGFAPAFAQALSIHTHCDSLPQQPIGVHDHCVHARGRVSLCVKSCTWVKSCRIG